MNSNAFAKGDALAKLIELIGADNKAFKAQDAELMASINEVREMFNTDELTVCSWDELVGYATAGQLEPGHAYKINHTIEHDGKSLANLVLQAKSNSEIETIAIADGYFVHIVDMQIHDAIAFDDLVKLIVEGSKNSFAGTNSVTTLTNLPVDKSTINAEISTDQALSFDAGLGLGQEVLCIIHNTGGATINIELPENCNETSLKIAAGEYGEVAVSNVGGTYYHRVATDVEIPEFTGGDEYEEITADDIADMFAGIYGLPR